MIQPEDDQESAALAKFMEQTSDLNLDEDTSLKFLRARNGNLEKAEEMLRKCVKWRSDKNINQYLHWIPPTRLAKDFEVLHKVWGIDNKLQPVIWIPLGSFKTKECIENGFKEDIVNWAYHVLEKSVKLARENQRSQIVFILDCKNLSIWQVLHRESMQVLYGSFQDLEMNYPEIISNLVVINAPKIFSLVFKIIKPILSERTISKMHIFGEDKKVWMEKLLDIMPHASIPNECL